MKLNVDCSFRDRQGTYGGLLKDDKGSWIWGFMGKSNTSDPLHAKLQALRIGLQALVDKGCNRVLVETDSSQALHLINGYPDVDHPHLKFILECEDIITRSWLCTVTYISRNANKCDYMTRVKR